MDAPAVSRCRQTNEVVPTSPNRFPGCRSSLGPELPAVRTMRQVGPIFSVCAREKTLTTLAMFVVLLITCPGKHVSLRFARSFQVVRGNHINITQANLLVQQYHAVAL